MGGKVLPYMSHISPKGYRFCPFWFEIKGATRMYKKVLYYFVIIFTVKLGKPLTPEIFMEC